MDLNTTKNLLAAYLGLFQEKVWLPRGDNPACLWRGILLCFSVIQEVHLFLPHIFLLLAKKSRPCGILGAQISRTGGDKV